MAQATFLGCKTSCKSRRACANDYQVRVRLICERFALCNLGNRLAALLYRVTDQAHATKFTRDVDARNIGLKIRSDVRNVDAPLGRAEN